ncbi:GNAT family N-acetyltransferase [Microbacterium sp. gxy059]|uniref:GNAT family N-acetyltransferase n=1 Tax=Microbacterium sp. gxy059 TaxID=2957199 RepID=UPI003D97B3BF
MRLTNIAHLRLPFGRLVGYDVSLRGRGSELPVSFDQRRHVAAGARDGSWMALSFRLGGSVSREALEAAWLAVIARHGTMRAAFDPGEHGPIQRALDLAPGRWTEHPIGPGQSTTDALRDVLDRACTPYAAPSHRLCALETDEETTIVIGADHAHVDMWSMLVLARDLLRALAAAEAGEDPRMPVAPDFSDHTRELGERVDVPDDVRARWSEVLEAAGGAMPRFPLSLGGDGPHPERVEVRDVLDLDDSAAFAAQAREEGVSTLSLAVSVMTAVTREVADQPLRAVFPVHSRWDGAWHDAVGWFITNSVLESADADPRASAAAVREAVRLGSWPLAEVLRPWGGMPELPGMFAISWLDLRRLPVRIDAKGLDAQYVGATIRTDGVMLWFILDESGLHLRCRYPDTREARRHVGRWLDAVVRKLRGTARGSVSTTLRVDGSVFRVERATRGDVGDIMALLSGDEIAGPAESDEIERYERAYDLVSRESSHFLAAVRDEADRVVGTMQLSVLPALARGGVTRLQLEGFRVAEAERSRGLGAAMLDWAHEHGRRHGAELAQVAVDARHERSRAFYERHGYAAGQTGLNRSL